MPTRFDKQKEDVTKAEKEYYKSSNEKWKEHVKNSRDTLNSQSWKNKGPLDKLNEALQNAGRHQIDKDVWGE